MKKYIPHFVLHIARYNFAMLYAQGQRTLDVGCKEGLGSHLLSYAAKTLTLLDISAAFLMKARRLNNYFCPVDFIEFDLNRGFPEGTWGCITAFEVIEHVNDAEKLVREMAEHLEPGGTLVFSVPHMLPHADHKTLFDEERIHSMVSRYLTVESLGVQDKVPFSGGRIEGDLKCYVGVARKV